MSLEEYARALAALPRSDERRNRRFLARLAALIPRPSANTIRFHRVYAAHARLRGAEVPARREDETMPPNTSPCSMRRCASTGRSICSPRPGPLKRDCPSTRAQQHLASKPHTNVVYASEHSAPSQEMPACLKRLVSLRPGRAVRHVVVDRPRAPAIDFAPPTRVDR